MKVVALLPMKANSERVKGKNFRVFGNKPLYKWMLDKLIDIQEIDQIIINTDAENILIKNGFTEHPKVLIRQRKKEICGDMVSMNLVIKDDIDNVDSDIYLMTHTTNPLLTKDTIKKSIKLFKSSLENKEADSLFTVNKIHERFYDKNAKAINHDPKRLGANPRSRTMVHRKFKFIFIYKKIILF